ncbi:hypothetical protein TUSST3_14840 [Streptomyces sp. TUS-ST3]|nr:hypothetical protein TUSST3_14840 [Streptomyces sp. TUS-ST3]
MGDGECLLCEVGRCEVLDVSGTACADAVAASEAAVNAVTTAVAIGLDSRRPDVRGRLGWTDMKVRALRFQAVPPVGPAPECILWG